MVHHAVRELCGKDLSLFRTVDDEHGGWLGLICMVQQVVGQLLYVCSAILIKVLYV